MVELANITNAAGLDAGAKTALEQLVEVYKKHQGTNRLLVQYYEAKQPTPSIGIDNIPETVDIPTRCDWAAKAVTSVSATRPHERLHVRRGIQGRDARAHRARERPECQLQPPCRERARPRLHVRHRPAHRRSRWRSTATPPRRPPPFGTWRSSASRRASSSPTRAAPSGARPRPCGCRSTSTSRTASW
ncbi:MAG: hypothetical protein ACLTSX_00915 [Collinsella sp.]